MRSSVNKVKIVEKRRGCTIINNVVVTEYHIKNAYNYRGEPIVLFALFRNGNVVLNNIIYASSIDPTLIDSFFFVHGYSNGL